MMLRPLILVHTARKILFSRGIIALAPTTTATTGTSTHRWQQQRATFSSDRPQTPPELRGSRTSYYEDLELTPEASSEDIKTAFYSLSKRYHPDLRQQRVANSENGDEDELGAEKALAKFQSVSEAFNVLSNPRLRNMYDKGVLGKDTSVAEKEARKHSVRNAPYSFFIS